MTESRRVCGSCIHLNVDKGTCHHPQAENAWGHLKGMANFMPEASYRARRWPVAPGWCGYFRPTEGWLLAAGLDTVLTKQKTVKKQKEAA